MGMLGPVICNAGVGCSSLNEEGAKLVALRTRQQLAVQALAFAGQAEQTVLQLFK